MHIFYLGGRGVGLHFYNTFLCNLEQFFLLEVQRVSVQWDKTCLM